MSIHDGLLPCPFCGETKDDVTEIIPDGYTEKRYEIVCRKCFGRITDQGSRELAIAAWSKRCGVSEEQARGR